MQMSLEKAPDLQEVPLLMSLAPNEQAREVFELMSITADIGRPFLTAPGVPADRVAALRQAGVAIKDLSTEDPDLEDVFLALTYGDPGSVDPTRD